MKVSILFSFTAPEREQEERIEDEVLKIFIITYFKIPFY